jgi:hypothetical protein
VFLVISVIVGERDRQGDGGPDERYAPGEISTGDCRRMKVELEK